MATRRSHKKAKSRKRTLQQEKGDRLPAKKRKRTRQISLFDADLVDLWDSVGRSKGLSTDIDIARFLLSLYCGNGHNGTQFHTKCVCCNSCLTLCCAKCGFSPAENLSSDQSSPSQPLQIQLNKDQHPDASHFLQSQEFHFLDPLNTGNATATSVNAAGLQCRDEDKTSGNGQSNSTNSTAASAQSAAKDRTPGNKEGIASSSMSVDFSSDDEEVPLASVASDGEPADADDVAQISQDLNTTSEKLTGNFPCPFCSQAFSTEEEHKMHVRTHGSFLNDKGVFACKACEKTFRQFGALYSHIKLRPNQQRCDQCNQVFVSRCQISKHKKQHETEETWFCTECNKSFPSMSKRNFQNHVSKHKKAVRQHTVSLCSECGKLFKKKEDLRNHMTYHNKENPFPCTFPSCNKAFKNKSCLRQHEIFHGEKRQQCEICGSKFYRKNGLTRHMQTHEGKRFACKECPRKYLSHTELQVHIKSVHQGVRPFPCTICELKFYQKSSLKTHMRTHTGEKPFQCEECPARFPLKASLRKHMRRHTGEKPYRCEDCGQVYSCQSSYKMHRVKHHSNSVYSCECGAIFNVQSSFAFHRKMCHDTPSDSAIYTKDSYKNNSAVVQPDLQPNDAKEENFVQREEHDSVIIIQNTF